ncbi:DNA adenine methylase, partial [Desulforegula conservatrix]|uniref:DNA adenine methylase n=1 Tax=Desulforegula conservatrix TaxID=153026 RepID=UPI0038BCA7EE
MVPVCLCKGQAGLFLHHIYKDSMNSPMAYVGGKSRLAAQIISMLPEHETYCEVCTGAGWVFFKK